MDLKKMYKGQVFSPTAVVTTNISATDTMIPVNDVDAFPDAPNIATIGTDFEAETIIYNSKTSSALSGCVRGVEGIAKDWSEGATIGRNYTAKDHGDMVDNIERLKEGKLDVEFKVEVTGSDEISIEGKALDATQNNKDIVGSLAYDLQNHKHIGVLETKPVLPSNANPNDIIVNGIYQIWDTGTLEATNFPITNPIGTLVVTNGGSFIVQTFTTYQGTMWIRCRGSMDEEWSEWRLVATQSSYTVTLNMFKNGWSQFNGHQYTKLVKTGNLVNLVGYVNIGSTDRDTIIFTVPAGYRPKVTQAIDRWNISFRLNADGTFCVFSTSITSGTITLNGISWEV